MSESVYKLCIKYRNLGWGTTTRLLDTVMGIATAIDPIIRPLGYTFTNNYIHDSNARTLCLLYQGRSPGVPIVAILAATAAVLLGAGFLLISISWYKEAEVLDRATQTQADVIRDAQRLLAEGKITIEEYQRILDAAKDLLPTGKKLDDWVKIGLILLGGVVVISLLRK